VEVELPILDRETGDLAAGAPRLLKACADAGVTGVAAELMQSIIELKTGVCADVAAVERELLPLMKRVRTAAGSLGFDLALLATHPFSRASSGALYPAERYERLYARLSWLSYQMVVFGVHVHVGVPDGDTALGVISMLVQNLPQLLAVSANSPFWQAMDTGLASTRAALFQAMPHAGIPRHFHDWREFRNYCRVMNDCKALGSFKDIYWDIRPRPDFGTVEFRICDVPPSPALVLALAAMTRNLVVSAVRLIKSRPGLRRGDARRHWIAVENKWLATRYGLAAPYIRTPTGKRRPLNQAVAELLDRLTPTAGESGDDRYFAAVRPVDKFESGSERQRRIYRETGRWKAITDDAARRMEEDLAAVAAPPPPKPAGSGAPHV
jgi:carboxylate-amine ligase